MQFNVTFEYDNQRAKWEVYVEGAEDATEAIQGFNAVILTCRQATPSMDFNKAELQTDGRYKISVGVINKG